MNLLNPAAGDYTVYVHGFAVPGTANVHAVLLAARLDGARGTWRSPHRPAATTGATGTISLTFSGLTPGTKYLGSVAYDGAAGLPNPTIVRVDP